LDAWLKAQECNVPKNARVFEFDIDIHGVRVTTRKEPICPGCSSSDEVDAQVKLLKDDLDAVAARMKAAIKMQSAKPPFGSDK
jgi:hypothetical protein